MHYKGMYLEHLRVCVCVCTCVQSQVYKQAIFQKFMCMLVVDKQEKNLNDGN